ncbi:type II toxin-antitoxin system RelE/ParE family toxin [Flavobacterium sp. HNIBRBA15423]|uniref:type II toxin-antitoxin system RelE/ParE family toxin n=1 Tax=Flavobacterium sp. HNIBRBA15423 TaxID=3458683 RepID=UPI004045129D
MVFDLIISKRAQFEIENAVEYHAEININLASKFYIQLDSAYQNITVNPYYQKRYKNFRGITITNFPFILFFIIEEKQQQIKILSCFHTSRDSKKYPK